MQALTAALMINGLRKEFTDTYSAIRNRQSDSRLSKVMDLGLGATNRYHDFAYIEAGSHFELWKRGDPIPEDTMGSVRFRGIVHNWGRRVKWHADDRADDQTQGLVDQARSAGESWGLMQERMFMDLVQATTLTMPAIPTAPDGAAFFATTAAGAARFGATNGNLLSGTGVAAASTIVTDYYSVIKQFMLFQDGKGQPLLSPETIQSGLVIIHAAADLQVFEEAFKQVRRGVVYGSNTAAAAVSNIIQDAARNVELWPTPRMATGDWYAFLASPAKKATFYMERQAIQEKTSFEGDNNSDRTRDTKEESIQWDSRAGAGIALPFSAIKVNN